MLSDKLYDEDITSIMGNSMLYLPKKTVTEKQIILDILYMISGIPGQYLSKKINTDQYQLSNKYQMTHLSANALQNALKQAIKMCNQAKYIQKQSKKLYQMSKNSTVKCFCQAVFDYLQEAKNYFSQMLAQVNNFGQPICNKITLISLTNIIIQKSQMFTFIIRCINTCFIQQQNKPQVVRLLDKIWEIDQQLLPYSDYTSQSIVKLFKRTLQIYYNTVQDFLCMKRVPETLNFFITSQQDKKGELLQNFLHRNNQIDITKLPKMLQNQSKGILQIYKTIRFIKLYYEDYEMQKLMNYLNISQQFLLLKRALCYEDFKTFNRVKVQKISINQRLRNRNKQKRSQKTNQVPEQNPYEMFTSKGNIFNINWIEERSKKVQQNIQIKKEDVQYGFLFYVKTLLIQILQNINKKCLQFFKSENDTLLLTQKNRIKTSLSNSLIGIKKFMLLEQGDFVQQFLSAAQSIIDKDRNQISHTRIYSCIDLAIECSNAKYISKDIINNIHFDFIKSQRADKAQKIKLWVLFCFNYHQIGPMSYIFNANMIQKIKNVCNMIFKLKKGQWMLTKIWDESRTAFENNKNSILVWKKARLLRNSLIMFVGNCLSYMLTKIDVIWSEFLQRIEQASTVFNIVNQTVIVVQKIQKISIHDSFFKNGSLMGLALIDKFRKLHNALIQYDSVVTVRDVDQIQFQLRGVAQIVMKIPQLNDMINYNAYFDKIN